MSTDNSNVWAVTHAREWAKAVDKAGEHSPAEHPGHPRNWCPTCETVAQLTDVADALERVTAERDAEIERLMQWKAEASQVLVGWEQVWKAAGRPRPLGASKAEVVLAEIERLRAALTEVSVFPCVNNDGETEPCECCCLASLTAVRALGDETT